MNNSSAADPFGMLAITMAEKYFNSVFLSTIMVAAIIGNTIALHAFIVSPELKRITYYFIASLCISDLMVASFSIPLWITQVLFTWGQGPNGKTLPTELVSFSSCLDVFCGTWSIMSLAMISIERFICITYALRYFHIMTNRRVCMIFGFVAIYSMTATTINYTRHLVLNTRMYLIKEFIIMFMSYVFPVLIKLFAYSRIFMEAKRHSKQIAELEKICNSIETASEADSLVKDSDSISTFPDDSSNHSHHKNSNTSQYIRDSRSGSSVSWTVSPLARKKQFKKDRINDKTREDQIGCKHDDENSQTSSEDATSTNFSSAMSKALCFLKRRNVTKYDINRNGMVEYKTNTSGVTDKHDILVRQDTNGSIKSILKSRKGSSECNMGIIQEEQTYQVSSDDQEMISNDENNQSQSFGEQTELFYEKEDNRKRSTSCPESSEYKVEESLEPNDEVEIEKPKEVRARNATNASLLLRIFRASTKWSPVASPMLLQKSTRNKNAAKRNLQKARRFKKELRAAKVVALIMGTFLICWTPFTVLIICDALSVPVTMRIVMIAKDLHYLNSAINPVLYVILNKVYRNAIFKAIRKVKRHLNC